jgi:thiamine-monophosphate kinase
VDAPVLTISVTLLGTGRLDRVVRRSGALPGDRILVTGELGGSILGHHLDFEPRVEEAARLVETCRIHAMIDVSDGLSTDLHHLLEESGAGARIEAGRVPVSEAARRAAAESGRGALRHALDDGEDFELLFAVAPEDATRLLAEPPFATRLSDVGEIRPADEGCVLVDEEGREVPLRAGGHEHLRGPDDVPE